MYSNATKGARKENNWPKLIGGTSKQKALAETVRADLDKHTDYYTCNRARAALTQTSDWLDVYDELKISRAVAYKWLAAKLRK
ncbi:nucleoside diphosphate kinase [Paraburkholderia sp. Clong3]|uniref:hypothetical protein n=1 Tax=Paraburkholderia sp. Clong3 TaxID=2991061 RepID=UPI003D1E05F5